MKITVLPIALLTLLLLAVIHAPAQQPSAILEAQQRYYAALAEGVKGPNLHKTEQVGTVTGHDFTEVNPEGGFVVGFDFWKANHKKTTVVNGVRPIFQTALGRVRGNSYGHSEGDPITLEAKEGFAVAGLETRAGERMDQVRVIFMRYNVTLNGFNNADSYTSQWIGGPGHPKEHRLIPDQKMIVGIYGGSGLGLDHFGLLYLDHR
jgi:hypothetical protein